MSGTGTASALPSALLRLAGGLTATHGQGTHVWCTNGRKYLDFTTGIGVTSVGHAHPRLVKAIGEQVSKIIHAQLNCTAHERIFELMDRLAPLFPSEELGTAFAFSNSGSEAVENAIKLARHATGRTNVVVFKGSFHGRTLGAGSMTTSKTFYRAGFQPAMPGVFVAPFPYCHRCPVPRPAEGGCCHYPVQELRELFLQQTGPEETAAMIIEPVLGEGGYVPAPASVLREIRNVAKEHGILFIADEVQSGMGRTGKMWAFEHAGIEPDIVVLAKGIAGGMPLSAIATTSAIMDKARPGSIGGTYSGNAVSCAAALAVLDVFEEEGILENVQARSEQLFEGLRAVQTTYPHVVKDVRGLGLMIGVELEGAGVAGRLSAACADRGLLLLTAGAFETLRFIPPLTVSRDEMDEAIGLFQDAAREVMQ